MVPIGYLIDEARRQVTQRQVFECDPPCSPPSQVTPGEATYEQLVDQLRELLTDDSPGKYLVLYPNAYGGWTANLERVQTNVGLVEWAEGQHPLEAIRRILALRGSDLAVEPRAKGES